MGQALYRKYRSKSLDEIVGQEHITKTLRQAIDSGRLSHAYLFTGPRGVGKTSIARILAHEINGLPYDEQHTHIDIIEIDAASNRRIDEIRDLRDKVRVAPASAKYKVYIIDEVHMLTREAFNALLKTLEEPPAHAIFILATTEAHKLPETIISRTQQFIFRPIEPNKAVAHLAEIAKTEKIAIEPAALELIATHGDGSFRDSISLLDQAGNHEGTITVETIRGMLGIPADEAIDGLVETLLTGAPSAIGSELDALYGQGFTPTMVASRLSQRLRQQLLDGANLLDAASTIQLLDKLLATAAAHNPERYLEIVLLGVQLPAQLPAQPAPVAAPMTSAVKPAPTPKVTKTVLEPAKPSAPEPAAKPAPITEVAKIAEVAEIAEIKVNDASDVEFWQQVLDAMKKQYNTLYGIIRMAQPVFNDDRSLTLTFAFAFHQKRVKEAKSQKILNDIITELGREPFSIICVVDPDLKLASKQPKLATASAIDNIFGGSQVL